MRAYLDLVATCAALAFLLLIAWPAYEYAYEESFHHHAGAADSQHLARRGVAGRHRPDGAVCIAAAGAGRQYQGRAGARSLSVALLIGGILAGAGVAASRSAIST